MRKRPRSLPPLSTSSSRLVPAGRSASPRSYGMPLRATWPSCWSRAGLLTPTPDRDFGDGDADDEQQDRRLDVGRPVDRELLIRPRQEEVEPGRGRQRGDVAG